MRRVLTTAVAVALVAAAAFAVWTYEGQWGSVGKGNGEFVGPQGIAVAPGGRKVYVSDCNNDRIQYFTATGSYLGKWGSRGRGNGQFNYPRGVAVAPPQGTV